MCLVIRDKWFYVKTNSHQKIRRETIIAKEHNNEVDHVDTLAIINMLEVVYTQF